MKEQFGGMQEVSLLQQDLQKIRERTTTVESRVSEIDDQIRKIGRSNTPLARDTNSAYQMAKEANVRAQDLESHLRSNNIHIVGLTERVQDALQHLVD